MNSFTEIKLLNHYRRKKFSMIAEQDAKTDTNTVPATPQKGYFKPGSASVCIMTLAKGTLGAGVLALSKKAMFTGIPFFLVLLCLGGYFTAKSIPMITKGADKTGKYGFEEITDSLFGRTTAIVLGVSMLLNCYGASIVYVIAIKDSLGALLNQVYLSTGNDWPLYATLIIGGLILIPLSIVEKLNSLRILSMAGVVGVFFTVASVVYALCLLGVSPDLETDSSSTANTLLVPQGDFVDVMTVICAITFAFCNQYNVPQLYGEMTVKTASSIRYVAIVSTLMAMVLYVVTGICGYLCYGLSIEGDILANFTPLIESGSVLIYIGVIAVTWSVTMCHLLNNFPMRLSVLFFLPSQFENNRAIKWGVPLFTAVSTIAIALLFPYLNVVLGLVGSLTGSIICYIVPGMISLRVEHLESKTQTHWMKKFYNNPTEYIMIVVGVIIGVVGTFCEVYSFSLSV